MNSEKRLLSSSSWTVLGPYTQDAYKSVDWASIHKKLCVLGRLTSRKIPDVFDGISVEDVASDVLLAFFESPNALGWNPAIGPLDKFLMGIFKHKIIDRLRRQAYVAGSLDDPNFADKVTNAIAITSFPRPTRTTSKIYDLLSAAHRDPKLHELLKAGWNIDGKRNRNQQLAKEMNTTPTNVVNHKKRLKRLLRKKRAYEEMQ